MIVEPWEWQAGAPDCIRAIKEHMRKRGFDWVEVWVDQIPDGILVQYCYPPINVPHALYRGRT